MSPSQAWVLSFAGALAALAVAVLAVALASRPLFNRLVDRTLVRLLKDPYRENLWDLVVGMTRVPPHALLELELRADSGELLERPLGTVVRVPTLTGVAFNPAQIVRPPLGPRVEVDTRAVLGPRAARPLELEIPIMVSAMSYVGVGLSKAMAVALARGAAAAGTAYNAGLGPMPTELLVENYRLIVQFGGAPWSRQPEALAGARMIEIRLGHGARASLGRVIPARQLPPEVRAQLGLPEDGEVVIEAPVPGAANGRQLRALVPLLRALIGGGPVGVKLAATHDLERELAIVLEAGVDVIAIDGAEGGTHMSPPVIADDFGIPSAHALVRAVRFLERTGARREVSLVVGGGLRTPGEMLKMLALGADAVYIGTAAMMAATHSRISESIPFEPVTQVAFSGGARAHRLDPEHSAQTVANFLRACAAEMAEAARALGKRSLREISREDLVARDRETAEVFGLPPSWRSPLEGSGAPGGSGGHPDGRRAPRRLAGSRRGGP